MQRRGPKSRLVLIDALNVATDEPTRTVKMGKVLQMYNELLNRGHTPLALLGTWPVNVDRKNWKIV